MIIICRLINGISINGKEALLDEDMNPIQFENKEAGIQFLKDNGVTGSDEEIEDAFFFDDYITEEEDD